MVGVVRHLPSLQKAAQKMWKFVMIWLNQQKLFFFQYKPRAITDIIKMVDKGCRGFPKEHFDRYFIVFREH